MNRRFVKPFFNNFLKLKLIKMAQQNAGKIKPPLESDLEENHKESRSENVSASAEVKRTGKEETKENKNSNKSNVVHKINTKYPESILSRFYSSDANFNIGDEAVLEKLITEEDIHKFIEVSGDSNPIHYNQGKQKAVVHGAFLNSLVSNVIGTKLPGPGAIVTKQTLNFPSSCFVGETVKVRVKVTQVRKIIKVEFTCKVDKSNEPGKVVMFGEAQLLYKNAKENLEPLNS